MLFSFADQQWLPFGRHKKPDHDPVWLPYSSPSSLMKRPPVLRPTLVLATLMRSQTQQAGEATFHYVDFFFFCCFFFCSSAFFPSPFFVVVDVVSFSPVSRQMSFWLVKKMSLSNARQVERWKSDTPRGGGRTRVSVRWLPLLRRALKLEKCKFILIKINK